MKSIGISKIGLVRQRNEDRFYADNHLLIVADGMGGYTGGEYASTMVVDTIVEEINRASHIDERALEEAIQKANTVVFDKASHHRELQGMGTTVVVAYVKGHTAYWAHVGDSRLYHFTDQSLHRITTDHSMVQQLLEAGTISESDMMHHPKGNMLTRAIGVYETVQVDSGTISLDDESRLLLCSDGLSGYIEDAAIEAILQQEQNETRILEDLVQLVYDKGARDNVTIVVGRI